MPNSLLNFSRYFKKDTVSGVQNQPVAGAGSAPADPLQTQNNPYPNPSSASPIIGKVGNQQQANPQGVNNPPSAIDMKKRIGMDVLSRLTQRTNQSLMLAANKAKELKLQYIDTEHVFWALLHDSTIYQLISECKAVPAEIQAALEKNFKPGTSTGPPQFSPRVKRVLELSLSTARQLGYEFISPEHILLALSYEGEGVAARTLSQFNLKQEVLNQKITGRKEMEKEEEKKKSSTLEQFTEDLTAKAAKGDLDPVVGRSQEIERIIHILSRRTKNNPCLIGDAGVGKTAIVEGLALRIAHGDVPETLLHKKVLSLDLMSLIAGASHRGEFEERLKNLIKEVKAASGAIILYIDELHNMVGAGSGGEGTMDASNILKPALARGELQAIGTTTVAEYRRYIEKDAALERRFQPVLVSEPTADVAIEMLTALRDKYEAFHRVKITDEAINAAVKLSQRYIGDRFLPDKAIDLIDEAAASVRLPAISLPEEIKGGEDRLKKLTHEKEEAEKLGDKVHAGTIEREIEELEQNLKGLKEQYQIKKSTTTNVVGPEIIADIISRWTGIPISKLTESETAKLVQMEDIVHRRLIDQEEAVSAVSEAVRRGRAGLKSNKRPIGSFIFMGPTGVGKTELAKSLAEILFGTEEMIVRLDMTEYMEKHEVAKLIGAPPGYVGYEEGGQLTEAVRRHPYAVVLFDEIEKAHPDVFNILIQLLDDGRLTDNKGHTISFKNTIVICTSNLGSGIIQEELLKQNPNDKIQNSNPPAGEADQTQNPKTQLFKTYAVSPTGREIITLREDYWEKNPSESAWKNSRLVDYFAGGTIIEGSAKDDFPKDGFDTHLIASDGSETITSNDKLLFRTSTTSKEWILKSILEQYKDHVVINALPDHPTEQLPTARFDTHAVSPANAEVITFNDRFWKRDNLQTKDWTTGLLSEYFANSTLKDLEPQTTNKTEEKPDRKKTASLIQQRSVAKPGAVQPVFPIEKWDVHLFKPEGTEIIIAGDKFFQRDSQTSTEWSAGSVKELFTNKDVMVGENQLPLPLGGSIEEQKTGEEKSRDERFARLAERLMEELRKFFRPELLNRFDEVIIFKPLTRKHMGQIVDLQMKSLTKTLLEQNIAISVSEAARGYLAESGFDPVFGARPLRRTIQRMVENQISSLLIGGKLTAGDTVIVDFDPSAQELSFNIEKFEKKKIEESKPQTQPQDQVPGVLAQEAGVQTVANQSSVSPLPDSNRTDQQTQTGLPQDTTQSAVDNPSATANASTSAEVTADKPADRQPAANPTNPLEEYFKQSPTDVAGNPVSPASTDALSSPTATTAAAA